LIKAVLFGTVKIKVDSLAKRRYNRYIQTQKEPKMTDAQIIVTVLVVAVVFAVKVWILTKI
jgi:hypothetical protein